MPRKRHSSDTEIGSKLRALRVKAGLSQTTLGNALGITFQQIQKYEKGTNRISGSAMILLGKALKVSPSVFFGPDGKGEMTIVDPRLDSRTRHLLMSRLVELDSPKFEGILLDLVNMMTDMK